jgi:hypothetical protein
MVWQGVVLEDSLADKKLLGLAKVINTRTSTLEEEERTMAFHSVEVQDQDKDKYLDYAMRSLKPAFYTHLCNGEEMYVVYKGVIFNFRKEDPILVKARDYGKSLGIIEAQMPFEHLIDNPFD